MGIFTKLLDIFSSKPDAELLDYISNINTEDRDHYNFSNSTTITNSDSSYSYYRDDMTTSKLNPINSFIPGENKGDIDFRFVKNIYYNNAIVSSCISFYTTYIYLINLNSSYRGKSSQNIITKELLSIIITNLLIYSNCCLCVAYSNKEDTAKAIDLNKLSKSNTFNYNFSKTASCNQNKEKDNDQTNLLNNLNYDYDNLTNTLVETNLYKNKTRRIEAIYVIPIDEVVIANNNDYIKSSYTDFPFTNIEFTWNTNIHKYSCKYKSLYGEIFIINDTSLKNSNLIPRKVPPKISVLNSYSQWDISMMSQQINFYRNTTSLRGMVTFKDEYNTSNVDDMKKQLNSIFNQGSKSSGKIAILPGDAKYNEISLSNQDQNGQLFEDKFASRIYTYFHIPLPLATDKSIARDNFKGSLNYFINNPFKSRLIQIKDNLQNIIPELKINYDYSSIVDIIDSRLDISQKLRNLNIYSPEEIKAYINDGKLNTSSYDVKIKPEDMVNPTKTTITPTDKASSTNPNSKTDK